jgi:serine/threonine protein kinase
MDSEAGFRPGDVVLKKYLIEEVLGEGGMGLVFKAKHLRIGESVALKLLHPEWAADPTVVARFEQEARASIRIRNEHVARVMDIETLESGAPLMVMELLEGRDLSDEILGRQVPLHEAVDLILQACTALAEAHSLGIIHRDIKPANLFLTRRADGVRLLKVLDFGIAKALDNVPDDTSLTRTQDVIGSPMYMSPEQIRSSKNVDQRTDIWSLGVIFFEMLSGDTPFGGETSPAVLAAISADAPRELPKNIASPKLEAFMARALAKRPQDRFENVAQFAEALAALSPGYDETVRRIARVVHGQRPAPDSFQQTVPGHGAEKPSRRAGTTTSDPTVLDESGRYAPVVTPTLASGKGGRSWLVWAGAAALLGIVATLSLLLRDQEPDEVVHKEVVVREPVPAQRPALEIEQPPADLPAPAPSEELEKKPPVGADAPVPTASPAKVARPKVTTVTKPPSPSPAPKPAVGSLLDEATESRK